MRNAFDIGDYFLEQLARSYEIREADLGSDGLLKKKGMVFRTHAYEIVGLGHFSVIRMDAMLGMMQMQTAVLSTFLKDIPLFNSDRVRAFGKETHLAELYDVQLTPYPEEYLKAFDRLKQNDSDISDYVSGSAHWYDEILYPCSYGKTGRHISERVTGTMKAYIETFLSQAASAPDCDEALKKRKIDEFVRTLFSQGGPAVDKVRKLFGEETAKRLIVNHMYGIC
ncbi:MAG: hypothetical protein K5770_18130 [Lachnospiraceae bacterium]|nr:hypothetical protein [Lachnospiraceae bacterium]